MHLGLRCSGLQSHNEELARKSAAISEEDFEAMRAEFQGRLETAERKVYALTKERDALRRGTDKLSSANDLLKEKDSIISQVGLYPYALISVSLGILIVMKAHAHDLVSPSC